MYLSVYMLTIRKSGHPTNRGFGIELYSRLLNNIHSLLTLKVGGQHISVTGLYDKLLPVYCFQNKPQQQRFPQKLIHNVNYGSDLYTQSQ